MATKTQYVAVHRDDLQRVQETARRAAKACVDAGETTHGALLMEAVTALQFNSLSLSQAANSEAEAGNVTIRVDDIIVL